LTCFLRSKIASASSVAGDGVPFVFPLFTPNLNPPVSSNPQADLHGFIFACLANSSFDLHQMLPNQEYQEQHLFISLKKKAYAVFQFYSDKEKAPGVSRSSFTRVTNIYRVLFLFQEI